MKNIIYYRSNDEVNVELARSWCAELRMGIQIADQRDELFPSDAAAVAIDVNHLALRPLERAQFVRRLCNVLLPYPVAVACYDLEREVKVALEARGWFVFRRIERDMFHELA